MNEGTKLLLIYCKKICKKNVPSVPSHKGAVQSNEQSKKEYLLLLERKNS
jgi:hypothetical protein